jgi:prepilin-type N-terminal cleavage/methylation domain-containing protein
MIFRSLDSSDKEKGFTLVEMAVVAAIIGFLGTLIIINFSRSRIDVVQGANLTLSTIRAAQTKAIASTAYGGHSVCGYGIHYDAGTQKITTYVGPNSSTSNCSTINTNYQSSEDTILSYQTFTDSRIEVKSAFNDIFFVPPDPKTYLNNNASLNQSPITIQIGVTGTTCPTNCKTIYVYPSGKIEAQ